MTKLRDNEGFTLVELIVAIAVGSAISMAVIAALLLGLRFFHQFNEAGIRQNNIRAAITFMEDLLAESTVGEVQTENDNTPDQNGSTDPQTESSEEGTTATEPTTVTEPATEAPTEAVSYKILSTAVEENGQAVKSVLLSYNKDDQTICTGSGTEILTNVTASQAKLQENGLLTITMTVDGEPYSFAVFCRMAEIPKETTEAANTYGFRDTSPQAVLTQAIDDKALTFSVRAFLKTLGSQVGSTGRIQTETGEGDYYSAWYIGGYDKNPGWDADTPWCGCFISWAMEENRGYIRGKTPKFANVDTFWMELVERCQWKTEAPEAGDIIFFDWIVDEEQNPQHVGVVLGVVDGWVYTIEGNSNGKVELCQYALGSPHIMGYGLLNWVL